MVSPAPLAAANTPPLSYADSAKKAPNAKTSSQVVATRHNTQSVPTSTANITASTAHSSATPRPAALIAPNIASKASSSSRSTTDTTIASTASPPLPGPSAHSATPLAAERLAETKSNGDVSLNGDSTLSAPSVPSTQKQAPAPPVNVWNIRKEQMAARALNQNQPRTTNTPSVASNHILSSALLSAQPPAPEASAPGASSSQTSPNPSMKPSPVISATNGHPVSSTEEDDPFVVRLGRTPPNPTPPAIDDTESWPQVRKRNGSPYPQRNCNSNGQTAHSIPDTALNTQSVAIGNPVALLVQPLRPLDKGPNSKVGRIPRAVCERRLRMQGSVHSSPRHSSVRGGGRRLPDDGGVSGFSGSRSLRSSGPSSPSTFAQPQPLPAQEFIPSARPFINTNIAQTGVDGPFNSIPESSAVESPHLGAYYPPNPQPLGVSPYHSPRPAGSPATNPYALPPMVYPGQPGIPAPVPVPGYGTPPYPVYPPYPYVYGQPYMYWHPPGAPPPGMPVTSPTAFPADIGVPPPTMIVRPPPPSESEAVAGYREVGPTSPPPVDPGQIHQGESVPTERGRRTRELSFGTIAVGGGETPNVAPGSPSVGAVADGAVLGLDVAGERESASVAGEQRKAGEDSNIAEKSSKGFSTFSIGVSPGELGPARLRSRTRTQSRGAVAAVQTEGSAASDCVDSGATSVDSVAVLADVAAKVIDLTDPETKWEFGTTKQGDEPVPQVNEDRSAPPVSADLQAHELSTAPPPIPGPSYAPMAAPYPAVPPYVPPVIIPSAPLNGVPSAPSPSAYTPRQPTSTTEGDEWAVRDYGYGFGRGGPSSPYAAREDRPFRERRDFQPQGEREPYRPRRGSYSQGGHERGSYPRRRGLSGGYGGRGYSNRAYSGGRGGYPNPGQQRQPPYVPPPPPPQPDVSAYYAPPIAPLATYIPSPYEAYPYTAFPPPPPPPHMTAPQGSTLPPLPVPQTQLLFPLDSTRYYLLGQLEYYLSSQNLAQDFYLRQQMDSRGWIPIPLIASFNRVQKLTTDPQLVTDVLVLSSLVEVRDGYVRTHQWQQFVLPTAQKSRVEPDDESQTGQNSSAAAAGGGEQQQQHDGEHHAHHLHEGDDEEDEDVEFVL
ncbi:hypothetical protein C8Q73DRAFT_664658 [Cubamyces lactineus]|nr:hypothetical protein C8Q73DRAFT_664658 [Cubamyces lactineus]